MIAIIGVLVALLLPAVQASRESARRTKCANNLKQFGLALHSYHATFRVFPANSYWWPALPYPPGNTNRNGGVHVKLLPYMEESALSDRIDLEGDVVGQMRNDFDLATTVVPYMRCPSDDFPALMTGAGGGYTTPEGVHAITNYGTCVGAQATGGLAACETQFPGNEFGNGPSEDGNAETANEISGVFSRRAWAASINQISDGTSKTIAMGEALPGCSTSIQQPWWLGSQWYGGTAPPLNFPTCPGEAPGNDGSSGRDCNSWNNNVTDVGFKSRHPGGVQFAFADGSVRLLSDDIEYRNYQRLGDRRDGEPIDTF